MTPGNRRIAWLVALGSAVGLVLLGYQVFGPPDVALSAARKGDRLVFTLGLKRANGLLGFRIVDPQSSQVYWNVDLNYYPGPILVYGEVPSSFEDRNGNVQSAVGGRKPSELPRGKELRVCVNYQYDNYTGACSGEETFALVIAPDGTPSTWRVKY
jgi:hypothetical protein